MPTCPWCGEQTDRSDSIIKLPNGDRPHYKCSDQMLDEWSQLNEIEQLLWSGETDKAIELAVEFHRRRR